ncbi:MAG: HU family DNA-binding protein [Bacteroides sp.]|nr:HU family DNA-binding protein [Bacteroides sp.]
MAVPFKKVGYRKDFRDKNSAVVYHPRLVTMGQTVTLKSIAYEMKEKSSLSYGDIKSVLTNFVEAMRTALYNGHSVNIQEFGVFSLSSHSTGVADVKDCTAKTITSVKINFRASSSVKPNLTSTRAGKKIDFLDVQAAVDDGEGSGNGGSSSGSGSGAGGGDDQEENPLG